MNPLETHQKMTVGRYSLFPNYNTLTYPRYLLSFQTHWQLPCFSARDSVQEIASYLVVLPPRSSLVVAVSQTLLVFHGLDGFRNADWVDCKKPCLELTWIDGFWGRKTIDAKCHFIISYPGYILLLRFMRVLTPDPHHTWLKLLLVRLFCKITLFFFFWHPLQVTICVSKLNEWGLTYRSFRME